MKLFLAVLWTGILIVNISSVVAGNSPDWMDVFCPLSILCLRYWVDVMTDK